MQCVYGYAIMNFCMVAITPTPKNCVAIAIYTDFEIFPFKKLIGFAMPCMHDGDILLVKFSKIRPPLWLCMLFML